MSAAARSVLIFGVYLALLGVGLVIIPNPLIGLYGMPSTNDVWVRVTGALVFLLGYYYIESGRKEALHFFRLTVYGRMAFFAFCVVFVLLGLSHPGLLIAGSLDLLGALWTALALRSMRS